jgi:ribonuclease VapC
MLDASALLAFLSGETGSENVPATSGQAMISAVNYAEAVSVLTRRGVPAADVCRQLSRLILDIVEFGSESAEMAGFLIEKTKSSGLSLGDRACLAEASRSKIPALTADQAWHGLDIGVPIQFIR